MIDFFALLDEDRRPWIDVERLKSRFHERSAECHPDRSHNASPEEKAGANRRYTELNAAYECLAHNKTRLRHLLELELGEPTEDIQQTPPDLMDTFFEIGQLLREVDEFLKRKEQTTSPLLKVKIFQESMNWTDRLTEVSHRLRTSLAGLADEIKSIDDDWLNASKERAQELSMLENIYRHLSYYERWQAQVQERVVQLSF